MSLRVAQLNFFPAPADQAPREQIRQWRLLDIPCALAKRGVKVSCFVSSATNFLHTEDRVSARFVAEHGWRARISGGSFPPYNLVREALRFEPDVFHVHGLQHAAQLIYLARHGGPVPIIAQDHANRPPHNRFRRAWHRHALRQASTVTFTELTLADAFIDSGTLCPDIRLRAVLEGSTRFLPGNLARAREQSGIDGAPCCLWVGDLNANKDPITALRAFTLVLEKLPDARLWMCFRQSPLLEAVTTYLSTYPALRNRVALVGAKEHYKMEDLHRAADFYISASWREAGAYSAIEALACGAIPIVTDTPVFRRITANGEHGGLFEPGDANGLCQRLLDWMPHLSVELRQSTRAYFEQALSLDVIADELIETYRGAVNS